MAVLLGTAGPAAAVTETASASDRNGGWLAYTDHSTSLGVGIDQDGRLSAELRHVLSSDARSGLIGEAWLQESAGGAKLTYNWIPADAEGRADRSRTIRKVFAAVDRNRWDDSKLSLGGGLEGQDGFLAAYLSHSLSGRRDLASLLDTTTTTESGVEGGRPFVDTIVTTTATDRYEKAFDWGIGIRAGRYVQDQQLRLALGADHEWGDNDARQTTLSVEAEKFFSGSPWSVTLRGEFLSRDDAGPSRDDDSRAWLILRRSFGKAPRRPSTYPVASLADAAKPPRSGVPTPPGTDAARAIPVAELSGAVAFQPAQGDDAAIQAATAGGAATSPATPAEPAVAAAQAAPAPTTRTEKRLVKTTVSMYADTYFKFDSAKLLPDATLGLDQMIKVLTDSGFQDQITLTGHTCDIGTEAYNDGLSLRRADSVKRYLVDKGGIAGTSIVAVGKGEREPKYPRTRAERHKNRRVDMEFLTYTEKEELFQVEIPAQLPPPGKPATAVPAGPAAPAGPTPATAADAAKGTAPGTRQAAGSDATSPAGIPTGVESAPPAAIAVRREVVELEPAWIRYGLLNTVPHKRTVDTYVTTLTRVSTTTTRSFGNRAPTASDDTFTLTSLAPSSLAVLANDSDPDGDSLSIEAVTQPLSGLVTIAGSTLTYTPAASAGNGSQHFTYTVGDGKGGKVTANVTIHLNIDGNRAPTALNDAYRVSGVNPSDLDVLANDSDPDGDPLSIQAFTQPDTGSVALSGNGFLFTPFVPFGTTTFTYTISDGRGGTATATVTLVDP